MHRTTACSLQHSDTAQRPDSNHRADPRALEAQHFVVHLLFSCFPCLAMLRDLRPRPSPRGPSGQVATGTSGCCSTPPCDLPGGPAPRLRAATLLSKNSMTQQPLASPKLHARRSQLEPMAPSWLSVNPKDPHPSGENPARRRAVSPSGPTSRRWLPRRSLATPLQSSPLPRAVAIVSTAVSSRMTASSQGLERTTMALDPLSGPRSPRTSWLTDNCGQPLRSTFKCAPLHSFKSQFASFGLLRALHRGEWTLSQFDLSCVTSRLLWDQRRVLGAPRLFQPWRQRFTRGTLRRCSLCRWDFRNWACLAIGLGVSCAQSEGSAALPMSAHFLPFFLLSQLPDQARDDLITQLLLQELEHPQASAVPSDEARKCKGWSRAPLVPRFAPTSAQLDTGKAHHEPCF